MNSFFEKLKRGMGLEGEIKEEIEKEETFKEKLKRVKKEKGGFAKIKEKPQLKELKIEEKPIEEPGLAPLVKETKEIKKVEVKETISLKEKSVEEPVLEKVVESKEKWLGPEGKLAVDVYQTEEELVIQSAIAGIKPGDLDITIEKDVISIRGVRGKPTQETGDYFTKECHWGPFSREIILPVEVDPNRIEATIKQGILTIKIPKIEREKKRKIIIKE